MERELMLTGIGGQGVQLAAQVMARAAVLEDRQVMFFGVYGGTMRGGNTESTLVVADAPIAAPPIVSRTWSALALHHEYFEALRPKLRPGAVVLLNESLFEAEVDRAAYRVFALPASRLAGELGQPQAASMLMLGAYAAVTGLVGIDALVAGMEEALPPYRRQHAAGNAAALRAGFGALPRGAAPAWSDD